MDDRRRPSPAAALMVSNGELRCPSMAVQRHSAFAWTWRLDSPMGQRLLCGDIQHHFSKRLFSRSHSRPKALQSPRRSASSALDSASRAPDMGACGASVVTLRRRGPFTEYDLESLSQRRFHRQAVSVADDDPLELRNVRSFGY